MNATATDNAMDECSQQDDEPPPSGLILDVAVVTKEAGLPDESDFRRWAEAALAAVPTVGAVPSELSIRVVGADESQQLNREWRQRDYPTNVLSFPGETLPGLPMRHLGDLVICAPVVAREAGEQDKPVEAHWAHMVVHGVLHLLGHDHQADEEAEHMEGLERDILAQLGHADPYLSRQ
jgi:probable rRNA maturation factor